MYLWQFVIYMYRNNSKSKKQNETLCISYIFNIGNKEYQTKNNRFDLEPTFEDLV